MGKVGERQFNHVDKTEMVKHLYTFPTAFYPIPRKCYVCNGLLQTGKCKIFRRQFGKSYTILARLCASLSYSRLRETAHHTANCAKTLYNFGHERNRAGEDRVGALFSVQDFPGVVRGIGNGFQFSGFRFQSCASAPRRIHSTRQTSISNRSSSPPRKAGTEPTTEMPARCCLSSRRTPGIAWPARQWDCRNVDMELSWNTYGTTAV